MIPLKVGKNTYKSISAAWRALAPEGLPMVTVRWRLKNGWLPPEALLIGPVPATSRREFKQLRTSEDSDV
jgi:hypothetical protein